MSQPTNRKPRSKPERKCRLMWAGTERVLVITEITQRVKAGPKVEVDFYRLRRIPADWGQAFEVLKLEAGSEAYNVHLDSQLGDTCCCKGFLRWGKCRHASALRAKENDGALADVPMIPAPAVAVAATVVEVAA
jgi:hypothetical protein